MEFFSDGGEAEADQEEIEGVQHPSEKSCEQGRAMVLRQPDDAWAHANLAGALKAQEKLDEAMGGRIWES